MTWNDITLRQWKVLENIHREDYEDEILYTAEVIQKMFDIKDAMGLTPQEFQKYVQDLSFLTKEIPDKKLANVYTINNTKYNFKGNIYELSMAGLMDWRKYSTKIPVNYAECLSVFMIPDGHTYNDGYDIDKVIEDMDSLPITDVIKLYTFFVASLHLSMDILISYFQRLMKTSKMDKQQKMEVTEKLNQAKEILDMTSSLTHFATQK